MSLSPRLRRVLISLAVMACIAVRKHDSFSNPQLWAEDGAIFLMGAETPSGNAWFTPYEGYLHILPRLIASTGSLLPMSAIPVFYACAALLIAGLTAWVLQTPRLRVPGTTVAALAIGVIPHTGEVYLTLCNLQWITALALFALVLMDDATTQTERVADVSLLLIVGLTGPFVLLALPLFAWRAWRRRSGWSFLLLGIALAVAAAHAPSLLHRPAPAEIHAWNPLRLVALVGLRTWVTLWTGNWSPGIFVCAAAAILFPAGMAWGAWRKRAELPGIGLLLAAALLVIAASSFKSRPDQWNVDDLVNGDRYFFVPKILTAWILAAFISLQAGLVRATMRVLLFLPLLVNAPRFIFPPAPPQRWMTYAAAIERGEPTMAPILPDGFKFWHPGRQHR